MFKKVFGGSALLDFVDPSDLPEVQHVPSAAMNPLSTDAAPPRGAGGAAYGDPRGRPPSGGSYPGQAPQPNPQSQSQPSISPPGSFPELASLSAQELRVLLLHPAQYQLLLKSVSQVRQMDGVVEELQRGNLELAKSTLAMETTIRELHTQCCIIRGTELASAQEQLHKLTGRYQEVYSTTGPSALITKLQEAAKQADKESEELRTRLAAGEMTTGEFVKQYRAKRKVYHTRHQTELAALISLTAR